MVRRSLVCLAGGSGLRAARVCVSIAVLAAAATALMGLAPARPAPAGTVAATLSTVHESGEESCHVGKSYVPPKELLQHGGLLGLGPVNGRLRPELRLAAARADAQEDLVLSAIAFLQDKEAMGKAYADLSVTGRRSFAAFRELYRAGRLTAEGLAGLLEKSPAAQGFSPQAWLIAATMTLDRAFRVANVLPSGATPYRKELGYIAVSGEDDQPYRPVNVPSAAMPQYDLEVPVGGKTVRTRYVVSETQADPAAAVAAADGDLESAVEKKWKLPEPSEPTLSDNARVVVYVHGMDSRLEEGLDLAEAFQKIGRITGENWTFVIMDLPTSGYADKLDHYEISPIGEIGHARGFLLFGYDALGTQNVPVLDFVENFIVSFIDTLDRKIPVKSKLEAVLGGSLGGNMTFRLGRRTDLPWLKNVVTWSPASVWTGLADGSDLFKQIGVATGWNRAGGDPANLPETESERNTFFTEAFRDVINFGPIQVVPAQPNQWWRATWPCFAQSKKLARIEREEIYNREFRLWHWRLGTEQLIFSQQGAPDIDEPRYLSNRTRMLLACGASDHFPFTDICPTTRQVSRKMVNTPGRTVVFSNTGHSIHNERPNAFATEITRFLRGD